MDDDGLLAQNVISVIFWFNFQQQPACLGLLLLGSFTWDHGSFLP